MLILACFTYVIVAPVFAGTFFLVTLFVEQLHNDQAMIVAALIGAGIAAPVTWSVAKAITERPRGG